MAGRQSTPAPGSTDEAFIPAPIIAAGEKHEPALRQWQGIPSIERAHANGRLWISWYTGGVAEDNDNFVTLATSADDGQSWRENINIIDPPGMARAFDPGLFHDPQGKLWWTWSQTSPMRGEAWDGRGGIFCANTDQSDIENPTWSSPRRISHGIAMNKPIITRDGLWVQPMAIWWFYDQYADLAPMRRPGVIVSADRGETWEWRGGPFVEHRAFDEPMVVQKNDGTLWMLIRTKHGISESFSMDQGHSWSQARPSIFAGPSSRFYIGRLASGKLLMINHLGSPGNKRSHLTAMLSDDDGATWPHRLLLDEREKVSYPDAVHDDAGRIWVTYDRDRFGEKEILLARFNEEDVMQGKAVSDQAALKIIVSKV